MAYVPKFLMMQIKFSLVSVTFKVNHYINFHNVLCTMLPVHTISDAVVNFIQP